jgi:hypothetical protein
MKNSKGLGGVRELSYDAKYARPNGQTAEEIARDARLQRLADKGAGFVCAGRRYDPHVAKPDRFYLLRFLGLSA